MQQSVSMISISKIVTLDNLKTPVLEDGTYAGNFRINSYCKFLNMYALLESYTAGGVLFKGKYSWFCNGSHLIVVNNQNGMQVASWNVKNGNKNADSKIKFVKEISNKQESLIAVILDFRLLSGLICIFDIKKSKIVKLIKIHEKVWF